MAVLTPAPTMYFDVDGSAPLSCESMQRSEKPMLTAKETVYHDAQMLPYVEPSAYAPPPEPKKLQCCGLVCCLWATSGVIGIVRKSECPVDNFQKTGKLSAIKEASLTKEQIMRKQTEAPVAVSRKTTQFQSMDNATSQELQEVLTKFQASQPDEEKKPESIIRKLSRKLTFPKEVVQKEEADNQQQQQLEKPSGIGRTLSRLLSRKITENITELVQELKEDDFLQLKKFHGYWDGVHPKNKPGNDELARVMALGWTLRKALDNMPGISIQVEKDFLKNQAKVFGLVDIKEERPWTGEKLKIKRKDLRGMATTWVEKSGQGFIVHSEWPDPFAAKSTEEYQLTDDSSLIMSVNVKRTTGESCAFKYYFTKSSKK